MRYHYTTGHSLLSILRDGCIEPRFTIYQPFKAVWFTTSATCGRGSGAKPFSRYKKLGSVPGGVFRIRVTDSYPLIPYAEMVVLNKDKVHPRLPATAKTLTDHYLFLKEALYVDELLKEQGKDWSTTYLGSFWCSPYRVSTSDFAGVHVLVAGLGWRAFDWQSLEQIVNESQSSFFQQDAEGSLAPEWASILSESIRRSLGGNAPLAAFGGGLL
jgi:hypothetical protein